MLKDMVRMQVILYPASPHHYFRSGIKANSHEDINIEYHTQKASGSFSYVRKNFGIGFTPVYDVSRYLLKYVEFK